jgi:hypothetical protein
MKIVINEYIDLVWEDDAPTIYVAGKVFNQCSFLAVTLPPEKLKGVDSIDQMMGIEESRTLEGVDDVDAYLHEVGNLDPDEHITPETIIQAHASNLIAWAENDYNPGILASSLSIPLLVKLVDVGDEKARRVLEAEISDRVVHGSSSNRIAMMEAGRNTSSGLTKFFGHDAWIAIASDESPTVRLLAAEDHATPVDVFELLAKDRDHRVRRSVAGNSVVPAEIIAVLSKDWEPTIRETIAKRHGVPSIVYSLAIDSDSHVRRAVAYNPSTTTETLQALSKDENFLVRVAVAGNLYTPADVLADLSKDEVSDVRERVAGNMSTPDDVLRYLLDDVGNSVREEADYTIRRKRRML